MDLLYKGSPTKLAKLFYSNSRIQCVKIDNSTSEVKLIINGIIKGSVFDPLR